METYTNRVKLRGCLQSHLAVDSCSTFLWQSHHIITSQILKNYPPNLHCSCFWEDSLLQTQHFKKNETGSGKFCINLPIQLSFPEVSHRWWTTGGPAAPDSGTNLNMQRHEKGKGSIEPHHYFFQGNATCPKIENLQNIYIYIYTDHIMCNHKYIYIYIEILYDWCWVATLSSIFGPVLNTWPLFLQ